MELGEERENIFLVMQPAGNDDADGKMTKKLGAESRDEPPKVALDRKSVV